MQTNQTKDLQLTARKALRPDPVLTICEWADKYRELSTVIAAEPGLYRTSRTPYIREPIDALSPASPVSKVVIMKGAQLGFTEAAINFIGYIMSETPGPTLAVLPTDGVAKRWSKQRVSQLIDDCKILKGKVRDKRSRDSGNTIFEKEFNGGILIITGANSPVGLRSMPARFRIYDEVDGFPADVGNEGDPVELAERRGSTFQRGKSLLISTPLTKGMSRIEEAYLNGSQAHYMVPCPECEEIQTIEWKRITWEKTDEGDALSETVVLECEHCGVAIEEKNKTKMLELGEWVHRYPDRATKSYKINSLYSPIGWFSWSQAVDLWVSSKAIEKRKVFINTVLGETWEERGEAPEWRRIYDHREDYSINTVPKGGLVLTGGVDIQKDRIECEIVAWGRDMQSWSVDYRIFMGDPEQSEVWKNLDSLLLEVFKTEAGGALQLYALSVDSGYATQYVYKWCRSKNSQQVFAIKGVARTMGDGSGIARAVGIPNVIDIRFKDGKRIHKGARAWPVNSGLLKAELYAWLRNDPPTEEEGGDYPNGYCHFPKHNEEFFKQLTAERMVTKTNARGYNKLEWVKHYHRNEVLDCRVYARAAGIIRQMDLWNEEVWDALEVQAGQPIVEVPIQEKVVVQRRLVKPSHMR